MSVSAADVARALRERVPDLKTTKLHKLLYYCQGHHLAAYGVPLFADTIAAFDMGPVVTGLWEAEKQGAAPPPEQSLNEGQLNTIGYVVSRYGQLTGSDLKRLSHSEAPWRRADATRRPKQSVVIRREWMQEYFAAHDSEDDEEEPLDASAVSTWLSEAPARRSDALSSDDYGELRRLLVRG